MKTYTYCKKLGCILFIFLSTIEIGASIGITNDITGGRFGDNVIQYVKTKWFAYTYGLDFYFQPFKEAKYLNASSFEQRYTTNIGNRYSRHIAVRSETDITSKMQPGTLFIVKSYAAGYKFNVEDFVNFLLLHGDQTFIDDIRQQLLPLNYLQIQPIPNNKAITVAVHIRRPSMGDWPLLSVQEYDSSVYDVSDNFIYLKRSGTYSEEKCKQTMRKTIYSDVNEGPLKFPPIQYHIDALKQLLIFFGNIPLHVVVFTDASDPNSLIEVMRRNIKNPTVCIELHNANWQEHIIEDYYLMSQFDCLIKSESTFSSISQLMGNHAITIMPSKYIWEDKKLVITERTWRVREQVVKELRATTKL